MNYDDTIKEWKKAYTDVLIVCEKYPDFKDKYASCFSDINEMKLNAKNHLLLIEWYEKYGLKLDHAYKPYTHNYFRLNDYKLFSYFNDAKRDKDNGSGKYISWPDDDRQPKDEWLFEISFSTGAYIFGEDYDGQKQLFQDFFKELQSYKPDYSDTVNKSLYWKLENTKPVFDEFDNVLRKYRERNVTELKKREAAKLRKQLAELEGKS
jgi:hypothetical protein